MVEPYESEDEEIRRMAKGSQKLFRLLGFRTDLKKLEEYIRKQKQEEKKENGK